MGDIQIRLIASRLAVFVFILVLLSLTAILSKDVTTSFYGVEELEDLRKRFSTSRP